MGFGATLLAFFRKEKNLCWQPVPKKRLLSSSFGRAGKTLRSQPHRPGKAELLGCRLGCCLPVADAQHRPKWQRRPVLNGPHWGPGPPVSSFATLCVAFKAVRLRLTNRKLFEKSLTKNFYAPTASRLRPCRRQEGGLSCPATGKLLRRFAVALFIASSYTVLQSLPHWCHGDCRGSKPPEAVYRENPSKSERLRFRWAKNRDSLPYGLPSLQQALIQLGNLFLTGVTGIAGAAGVGVGGLGQEGHVLLLQNAVEVLGPRACCTPGRWAG